MSRQFCVSCAGLIAVLVFLCFATNLSLAQAPSNATDPSSQDIKTIYQQLQ